MTNPAIASILSEIVRVADGRRFPIFDGFVAFEDFTEAKGKVSVKGAVWPENADQFDPIPFTLTLTT